MTVSRQPGWAVRLMVALIRLYQRFISPWLGQNCRFHPSCSQYAVEALQAHGVFKGSALATWRLLRCQPFSRGGFDPVLPAIASIPLSTLPQARDVELRYGPTGAGVRRQAVVVG